MITRGLLVLVATLGLGVVLGAAAPAKGVTTGRGGSVVRIEHRDPSTAPTRGPSTALVTIELFFDPKTNMQARTPSYRALSACRRIIQRASASSTAWPARRAADLDRGARGARAGQVPRADD
jgi:hypothetical protein